MKYTNALAILLFILMLPSHSYTQNYHLDSLAILSQAVPESSGLLFKEGRLITHNDSGGAPHLYEIDTLDGQVVREVVINNAQNIDWEDLTADSTYLYIGDIGNNFGNRTDLTIYKILWSEYLTRDSIEAQQINYSYSDQLDFSNNQFFTPYDAEALVAIGDSLFLFTKDWSTAHSKVYPLPKTPGTYAAIAIDSFAVPGLITGADLSPDGNQLLLSAYSGTSAFVLAFSDFTTFPLPVETVYSWPLPLTGSIKSEGICWRNDRFAYISTEQVGTLPSVLYRLDTDFVSAVTFPESSLVKVFPQPATENIQVTAKQIYGLELYNANGTLVLKTTQAYLDVSHLPAGMYFLMILMEGQKIVKQVIVI